MPLANLITRAVVGVALLPVLGLSVHWLSMIDASPARLARTTAPATQTAASA